MYLLNDIALLRTRCKMIIVRANLSNHDSEGSRSRIGAVLVWAVMESTLIGYFDEMKLCVILDSYWGSSLIGCHDVLTFENGSRRSKCIGHGDIGIVEEGRKRLILVN